MSNNTMMRQNELRNRQEMHDKFCNDIIKKAKNERKLQMKESGIEIMG